jgi:hypothetical protein
LFNGVKKSGAHRSFRFRKLAFCKEIGIDEKMLDKTLNHLKEQKMITITKGKIFPKLKDFEILISDKRKMITKSTAIQLIGSKSKFEKLNIPFFKEVDNPYYKCSAKMVLYVESDVLSAIANN